ncbi:MAG: DUF4982 domain-containing protein [Bacteroidales bacterium]|nr:DUF4982 domain-containing protein [Bacteroidales bacterium]
MKYFKGLTFTVLGLMALSLWSCETKVADLADSRVVQSFNKDWRFVQEDPEGAEGARFSDKDWRVLDVPHDWSIEGEFNRDHPTGRGGAYLPSGIGWYRKSFTLPKSADKRKVWIHFDGLMANSDVYINGHHLGHRPYGYVDITYELTEHLQFGKENVLAVRLDNTKQPASRWYTGAGIYRKVQLIIKEDAYVDNNGVFVTTPQVTEESAVVNVKTDVINAGPTSEVMVKSLVKNADGQLVLADSVSQQLEQNEKYTFDQTLLVETPRLWSLDSPDMYVNETEVWVNGEKKDHLSTPFGIRSFHFDAATGFHLNGENIRLKGVCLHHDGGAVGAAVPLALWEERLQQLKEIGINTIRTAHNPFATEFLDLCDQMGFFVMNETFDTWRASKNNADHGYQHYFDDWWEEDTRAVVLRDRNHPSIFMISVGNEIRDNLNNEQGFETYKMQHNLIHRLDGTRPVTLALFRPNQANVYQNGFAQLMDVVGQNYRENELAQASMDNPDWKVIGTENGHTRQAYLVWRDNPSIAGHFLWTGFDYLGEADWPEVSHDFGVFDRAGFTKPRTWERMSWWSETPMVRVYRREHHLGQGGLVDDWTPTDFDTYDEAHLEIYTNADEVEVFHNGQSLGTKKRPEDASPVRFRLTFQPGSIKAVARTNGEEVAVHELQTAQSPSKIVLSPTKTSLENNWDDVSIVRVSLVDEEGLLSPNLAKLLTFEVTGNGELVAVDNGARDSHESFVTNERRTARGQAIAIVRATADEGTFQLKVSGEGLTPASVEISIGQ